MRKMIDIRNFRQLLLAIVSLLLTASVSTVLSACRNHKEGFAEEDSTSVDHEIDSTVTAIYTLYIEGKYAEYVKQIESNDCKPRDYCEQMAVLHKVRHQKQKEENGGPLKCRLVKFEPKGENYGTAFLEVTYKDKTKETILQQMVKVKGRWRVR